MSRMEVVIIRGNAPGKGNILCPSLMTRDEYLAFRQLSKKDRITEMKRLFREGTGEDVSGPAIFYVDSLTERTLRKSERLVQNAKQFLSKRSSLASDFMAPETP